MIEPFVFHHPRSPRDPNSCLATGLPTKTGYGKCVPRRARMAVLKGPEIAGLFSPVQSEGQLSVSGVSPIRSRTLTFLSSFLFFLPSSSEG